EYEQAQTPYQRLMNSSTLTAGQKLTLQERKARLNPFQLQKGLQSKLKQFEEILRQRNTGLMAA
ncbi:MAG TPA: integrase, partial [Bdellovibrionota bacterium]|nr:integrase [Bdellovibrionota bacterium]